MLFNSHAYIFLFLPIVIIGFFQISSRFHKQLAVAWLVGASLFYYGWWNPAFISLIVGSMLFNYAVGFQLQKIRETGRLRRGLLLLGITVNLGLIGYFKYANFFIENINYLLNTRFSLGYIMLPLAISFFTFQQIAYLVDAYKGEMREYNFLHYFLFVTFFPQLIAGPIVHHKEMMPQFSRNNIFKPHAINIAEGVTIFAIGLFKKIVLADGIATYASPVFSAADAGAILITFFDAWEGALSYTLQIYFDFSGYTDMAIGSARLIGIHLPLNFNSPYKAHNIIDFWRRWHITLSRFFRDYVYIPLGGNRVRPARKLVNLMITMVLGGLWHGAGWTFVIWGALHGAYLIINHIWRDFRTRVLRQDPARSSPFGYAVSVVFTISSVIIGWVFFRAETVDGAMRIFRGMFGINGAALPEAFGMIHPAFTSLFAKMNISYVASSGSVFMTKWITILSTSCILFFPNSIHIIKSMFSRKQISDRRLFAYALYTAILFVWSVLAIGKPSEFLYFQF